MAWNAQRGAKTAVLFGDAQFSKLSEQATALFAALNRRAFELLGEAVSPELLIRAVSSTLSRAAKSKRSEAMAGPVVNLNTVREARAPVTVGYITLTPSNDALAVIDELACRTLGEANQATRAIVVEQALIRGLQSMAPTSCQSAS